MFGGLVGLLLGGGLLYCLRRFDSTVKVPADVTRYLKLASLGVVPDFSSKELRAEGSMPLPSQFESFPGVFPKELLLSYHPLSLVPEAYRNLRAELLLSRPAGPPRSLLVTSALSGEGKTLTALNTAIALAQMGTRVLVIDADLRHPQCHAVLKTPKGLGLTEFLTGQRDLAEVIQATRVDRLFFLSGGAIPPNPAELLGAKKMQAALSFLNHLYDYIVVDSPPLGLVSDALLLSSLVDGVMLVVNSQTTHYKAIQDAAARLDRVRAKVLGVVLNKVDAQSREYAEYYRRYRAYYRQSGANEEVVSVVDPKKRGESVSHGRTSPTKNGRKSPAKAKVGVEPRLLGVASASLPKEKEARAALVNDGSRENLSAVISSTQPHSRPTDTESTELPGQSEGREETILSPGIVDKKDDSLALVASDIDGSGIEVSQGDSSEVTDPDVVQSS